MIWDIDPIIAKIGFFELRYYSICFATGIFAAYYLTIKFMKEQGFPEEAPSKLLLYTVIGLILGAHFLHLALYEPSAFYKNPRRIIELGKGLASHGGVLGMFIAVYIFARKYKATLPQLTDIVSVSGITTAFFVRVGNFFNSEILGEPTTMPWGIVFRKVDEIPRHPAQLYEALALVIVFAIIYPLYRKQRETREHGFFTLLFFVLYFGARFFLEFSKQTQSELTSATASLDMGQWLSLPLALISLGVIIARKGMRKKA